MTTYDNAPAGGWKVFGTPPGAPPPDLPQLRPWAPDAPPPAPPRRRRTRGIVAAVVAVLAIAGVRVGMSSAVAEWRLSQKDRAPLHTPLKVGGYGRMTTGEARDIEHEFLSDVPSKHAPQAGVYGRARTPQYMLLAAFSLEDEPSEIVAAIVGGVDVAGAKAGTMTDLPGGLTCQSLTGKGVKVGVCAWVGNRSNGAVMAFRSADLKALAKVASAARAEVDA